ncbi:hypothetical protein CEXT_591231 [Caerostris extrusa]|uniref:Uncharacterized protein n=1 Tax=Caerostris extrusa TaxID=172846 RepID=A0AAV4MTA0_CAEEX|nr:hypothetical protein CEXT_591231 [Caerostris extrusa]
MCVDFDLTSLSSLLNAQCPSRMGRWRNGENLNKGAPEDEMFVHVKGEFMTVNGCLEFSNQSLSRTHQELREGRVLFNNLLISEVLLE